MRKRLVIPVLLLTLSFSLGCATKKPVDPNVPINKISDETAWRLKISSVLNDAKRDYIVFFTDVGDAQRNNQLTEDQVKALNVVGHQVKDVLDSANSLYLSYVNAPDEDKKVQLVALVAEAERLLIQLTVNRDAITLKEKK